MPPKKKQNNQRAKSNARSSNAGVNLKSTSNAHLNANLPKFAKTLLNTSMAIKKLSSRVSQENSIKKIPLSNGSSMTVKLISPALKGTDGELATNKNVKDKLYVEEINRSSDLNKNDAYGPKAITLKPQGQLITRDLRQLIEVTQKLPTMSYQNAPIGRNQVQFIKLPHVQTSKLRDIGMIGLKSVTLTQQFTCSSKTNNSHLNLHKLQNVTLVKNPNLAIVKQLPQPTLSVITLPLPNVSSANPCRVVSQLKLPSSSDISMIKTNLPQTSSVLSNPEKWIHVNSLKSAILSASKTPGQERQLSLQKKNNFPILQERKNGETNNLKKCNLDKPVGSSADEDIIILSGDEPEEETHSKKEDIAAPSIKKRPLPAKLLQTKEKPSKVLKTNDENSVPSVSSNSCVQVVASATLKQKQISKRYKHTRQQNFSSVTPVRKKGEAPPVVGVEAVYSNIKNSKGKKPKISKTQISEFDSSDSDFQKMDIDLFFMAGEFEIPSTDVLMHKSSIASNVK